MSARTAMRQRCTLERKTEVSDGGGGVTVTWATLQADVPCWAWFDAERRPELQTDGDRPTAVEDRRVMVPVGTTVKEGDRVLSVKDRLGAVIHTGPMLIDLVGRRRDHLLLFVREVT